MKRTLIVGLGNEGGEYAGTYHNAGTFVADLFRQLGKGSEVEFFNPGGFMNTIGVPIARYIGKNKDAVQNLLIIHDDSDQMRGKYKLTFGGGAGGHHGVESIISSLGHDQFWRLKIGIRDPKEQERKKAGDFVLQKMSATDKEALTALAEEAWPAITGKLKI